MKNRSVKGFRKSLLSVEGQGVKAGNKLTYGLQAEVLPPEEMSVFFKDTAQHPRTFSGALATSFTLTVSNFYIHP